MTDEFLKRIQERNKRIERYNLEILNTGCIDQEQVRDFDDCVALNKGNKEALEAVEKNFDKIIEDEWIEYVQTQSTPRNQGSNIYVFKQQVKRKIKQTVKEWKEKLV